MSRYGEYRRAALSFLCVLEWERLVDVQRERDVSGGNAEHIISEKMKCILRWWGCIGLISAAPAVSTFASPVEFCGGLIVGLVFLVVLCLE